METVMSRTTRVMHQALRERVSLLSVPFASSRKRRIANFPFSCRAPDQRRLFGSTSYASFPYPSSSTASSLLPPPTVVYSDNHLLAVNKPAGWHSVPNIPKQGKQGGKRNRKTSTDSDDATSTTQTISSKKCLLTHLQQRGLGGGSKKDFLVPLHRIDQPCTGILLFGKTSKAASRVTKVWKGKRTKKFSNRQDGSIHGDNNSYSTTRGVMKDYLCVVPTSRLGTMEEASVSINTPCEEEKHEMNDSGFPSSVRHPLADGTQWNQLDGLMLRPSAASSSEYDGNSRRPRHRQLQRKQQQQYYNDRLRKGRSVKILPKHRPGDPNYDSFYDYDHDADNAMLRPVHASWKIVHVPTIDPLYTLLLVRTSEGARHMVRALLAQVGECPILGDVRYWKPRSRKGEGAVAMNMGDIGIDDETLRLPSSNNDKGPLKDRSVALHAYGLYFDRNQLQLGSLDTYEFRAPIPPTWESFFGIGNDELQNLL